MSVENEKVCCNCKHKRNKGDDKIYCWCNFTGRYLSYAEVMTGWCRHWAKEKEKAESENKEGSK